MADNVAITAGSGTTIATDDVGGFHYQRVKPAFGPDGSATDVAYGAGLPTTGDYLEVTGSATSATTLIASTDCRAYGWVSIQFTSAPSATVTFQGSNDGTNWSALYLMPVSSAVSVSLVNSVVNPSLGTIFMGSVRFRYFRAQVTSYTSGTVSAVAEFTAAPSAWPFQPVYIGGVSGNSLSTTVSGASGLTAGGALGASETPAVTLDSSTARTTSGVGSNWLRYAKGGVFSVVVTAVSGTSPTLTVRVQRSMDHGTTWDDLDATNAQTAAITATGVYYLAVYPGLPNSANSTCNNIVGFHTRLAWTIGGTTPSFTFSTRQYALN